MATHHLLVRPNLHEVAPPLEAVGTRAGHLGRDADGVREGGLDDLARMIGLLLRPVVERGAENRAARAAILCCRTFRELTSRSDLRRRLGRPEPSGRRSSRCPKWFFASRAAISCMGSRTHLGSPALSASATATHGPGRNGPAGGADRRRGGPRGREIVRGFAFCPTTWRSSSPPIRPQTASSRPDLRQRRQPDRVGEGGNIRRRPSQHADLTISDLLTSLVLPEPCVSSGGGPSATPRRWPDLLPRGRRAP